MEGASYGDDTYSSPDLGWEEHDIEVASYEDLIKQLGETPTFAVDFVATSPRFGVRDGDWTAEIHACLTKHFTTGTHEPMMRQSSRQDGPLAGRTIITVVFTSMDIAAGFLTGEAATARAGFARLTLFAGTKNETRVLIAGRPARSTGYEVMRLVPEGKLAEVLTGSILRTYLTTDLRRVGPSSSARLAAFFKDRLLCLAPSRLRGGSLSATSYTLFVKAGKEDRATAPAGFEFPLPGGTGSVGLARLFWGEGATKACNSPGCVGSYWAARAHGGRQQVFLLDGRQVPACQFNADRSRPYGGRPRPSSRTPPAGAVGGGGRGGRGGRPPGGRGGRPPGAVSPPGRSDGTTSPAFLDPDAFYEAAAALWGTHVGPVQAALFHPGTRLGDHDLHKDRLLRRERHPDLDAAASALRALGLRASDPYQSFVKAKFHYSLIRSLSPPHGGALSHLLRRSFTVSKPLLPRESEHSQSELYANGVEHALHYKWEYELSVAACDLFLAAAAVLEGALNPATLRLPVDSVVLPHPLPATVGEAVTTLQRPDALQVVGGLAETTRRIASRMEVTLPALIDRIENPWADPTRGDSPAATPPGWDPDGMVTRPWLAGTLRAAFAAYGEDPPSPFGRMVQNAGWPDFVHQAALSTPIEGPMQADFYNPEAPGLAVVRPRPTFLPFAAPPSPPLGPSRLTPPPTPQATRTRAGEQAGPEDAPAPKRLASPSHKLPQAPPRSSSRLASLAQQEGRAASPLPAPQQGPAASPSPARQRDPAASPSPTDGELEDFPEQMETS